MKRTKHDDVFSKLVRERANYICESCGLDCRHDPGYLHCSHVVSRRHTATRYHPLNANSHCASCHRKFTDRPDDHYDWCQEFWTDEVFQFIRGLSRTTVKWPLKTIRESIYQHYRLELARLEKARALGEQGRIEFKPHSVMEMPEGYDVELVTMGSFGGSSGDTAED